MNPLPPSGAAGSSQSSATLLTAKTTRSVKRKICVGTNRTLLLHLPYSGNLIRRCLGIKHGLSDRLDADRPLSFVLAGQSSQRTPLAQTLQTPLQPRSTESRAEWTNTSREGAELDSAVFSSYFDTDTLRVRRWFTHVWVYCIYGHQLITVSFRETSVDTGRPNSHTRFPILSAPMQVYKLILGIRENRSSSKLLNV